MKRRTESGRIWEIKRHFIGKGRDKNKVMQRIKKADEKDVVHTRREKKDLYRKLKEFSGKRGVTETELRMALAELKYDHGDSLSKKEVIRLEKEMGVKVTKKDYYRAKEYIDRKHDGKSGGKSSQSTVMRAARAEEIIAKRRAARGRHKGDYSAEDLSHRGITKKDRADRRTRGRHKRSGTTTTRRGKTQKVRGEQKNLLAPTFRSSLRTVTSALDRLQKGGRSHYGASHETMRRSTKQYDRLGRLSSAVPRSKSGESSLRGRFRD